MKFFEKPVDLRSRSAMQSFLQGHYRYYTMSSVNRSNSYAHCVKLHRLGLTHEQQEVAYDLLATDFWHEIEAPIAAFTERHGGDYTIYSNGRSSGYLVLHTAQYRPTGHKSFCRSCGQRNFKSVAQLPEDPALAALAAEVFKSGGAWRDEIYLEQSAVAVITTLSEAEKLAAVAAFKSEVKTASLGNRCGRCGAEGERGRVNFVREPMTLAVSTQSLDAGEDFSEWSMDALRSRVRLVQSFDRTCDEVRERFIYLLEHCDVVEETVMVPTTVSRLACRAEL